MTKEATALDLLDQTTNVVAAFVSNNPVSVADLPALIERVYTQLVHLSYEKEVAPRPKPAVPIKWSVTDSHLICLEDGKELKMLKRYLRTQYDMSPDEYRARWGLPHDYPMVAPDYAAVRSAHAKKIGLGRK